MKAIIFDMDGVLIDSEQHHVAVERSMFEKFDLDISEKEHSGFMGKATDRMWKEIAQKRKLPSKVEDLVRQTEVATYQHFYDQKEILPIPGVFEILEKFKNRNIPMAVASSSIVEIIELLLRKAGIRSFFTHIVGSDMTSRSKPEPDVFLHAANLLGVRPEECLVVEDSENGIRAAKKANMYCVAFNGVSAQNQDQGNADVRIIQFSELEGIVTIMF